MQFEDVPRHNNNNTKVLVDSLVWGSLCSPDYANLLILITVDFLSAMKNFSARVKGQSIHNSHYLFKLIILGSSADQLSSLYMSPRPSSTLLHAQFSEQKTIPNGSQDG